MEGREGGRRGGGRRGGRRSANIIQRLPLQHSCVPSCAAQLNCPTRKCRGCSVGFTNAVCGRDCGKDPRFGTGQGFSVCILIMSLYGGQSSAFFLKKKRFKKRACGGVQRHIRRWVNTQREGWKLTQHTAQKKQGKSGFRW